MPQGIEKTKCNKRQQATIGRAIIGKDEVPSSNLGSSSRKTAFFNRKERFCFAFFDFLACFKFAIRVLTTEQATDRKISAPAVLFRQSTVLFSPPLSSLRRFPASSPGSAGPASAYILPHCGHRYFVRGECRWGAWESTVFPKGQV